MVYVNTFQLFLSDGFWRCLSAAWWTKHAGPARIAPACWRCLLQLEACLQRPRTLLWFCSGRRTIQVTRGEMRRRKHRTQGETLTVRLSKWKKSWAHDVHYRVAVQTGYIMKQTVKVKTESFTVPVQCLDAPSHPVFLYCFVHCWLILKTSILWRNILELIVNNNVLNGPEYVLDYYK